MYSLVVVIAGCICALSGYHLAVANGEGDHDTRENEIYGDGGHVYQPAGRVDLEKHLQPINVGRDRKYDDLTNDDGTICTRDCTVYKEPRICYYKFYVEIYTAMGPACRNCSNGNTSDCYRQQCVQADGVERMVHSINRMIPGTAIHVCYGDRIIVDVINRMLASSTSIHWHGILQEKTPWMDGVPYVTQCPIAPNQQFRYDFLAGTMGTNFYHSHLGQLQADGIYGAVIVRTPEDQDPNYREHDFDLPSHTLIVADWKHWPADAFWPGYYKNQSHTRIKPDDYLINGKGSYRDSVTRTNTPHAEFHVRRGYRYRFRIIGAVLSTCLYQIAFQDHNLTIVALDGYPVKPVRVQTLVMGAGQRVDVVIKTNRKRKSYWIVVKGIDICQNTTPPQTAYLVYDDFEPKPNETYSLKRVLAGPYMDFVERGCVTNPDVLCSDELQTLYPTPIQVTAHEPDHRFFLSAGGYGYFYDELFESGTYLPWHIPEGIQPGPQGGMVLDSFNNFSSLFPPHPLLTQSDPLPDSTFCPQRCIGPYCFCVNVLKVKLNSIVELVITDEISNDALRNNHPMHLHGHYFSVLKQGTKEERMRDRFWLNIVNKTNPVVRDVATTPYLGYSVLRWAAVNPGFWLFHCHFNIHLDNGMFLIFQVGERSEFRPQPKNFPRCNDYLPDVYDDYPR